MFKIITEKCNELGLIFMPNLLVTDFEQAIHNAVYGMFPLCRIIGCRFHLSQSWYRKIQNLGLATDYKISKTETGKWLRNIFGLSFLNSVEVGESYTEDFMSTIPEDHAVQEFSDYLVDNYISNDGLFPPHIWVTDTIAGQRTTIMHAGKYIGLGEGLVVLT